MQTCLWQITCPRCPFTCFLKWDYDYYYIYYWFSPFTVLFESAWEKTGLLLVPKCTSQIIIATGLNFSLQTSIWEWVGKKVLNPPFFQKEWYGETITNSFYYYCYLVLILPSHFYLRVGVRKRPPFSPTHIFSKDGKEKTIPSGNLIILLLLLVFSLHTSIWEWVGENGLSHFPQPTFFHKNGKEKTNTLYHYY